MECWNVGIVLFPDVEVLDFAGPFEVFSRVRSIPGIESRRTDDNAPFRVFTVARTRTPLRTTGGLVVTPEFGFDDHPPIELLLVPGGFGTRALLEDQPTLDWIRATAARSKQVTSVCTGSLVLARAGLLDGKRATTHWGALDALGPLGRDITVVRDRRVVEDGVITSAGVSAGIDMAFRVVERQCGRAVAVETARYIEYPWPRREFAPVGPEAEGWVGVTPMLATRDLAGTVAFYRDRLDCRVGAQWPAARPTTAMLIHGDVELIFDAAIWADGPAPQLTGQLSFEVGDVMALYQRLRGDCEVLWGPEVYHYGRREFSIRDPNGYALVFSEPTSEAPTHPQD